MPQRPANSSKSDRKLVLILAGAVVLVIVFTALFSPKPDDDPQPTTYNSGSHGIKAAYLLAQSLGYDARRWDEPPAKLSEVDAARTTLVLAEPILPVSSLKQTQTDIQSFLQRGGRVLATGASGARLLPGGETASSTRLATNFCYTQPEGSGPLARAGKVAGKVPMDAPVRWTAQGPEFRVEERCGPDAVVVRYPYGAGEAIWWSSPTPLTNAGMKNDPSLNLALASLGPLDPAHPRAILFDEYLHQERESLGDLLRGLPWWPLAWQALAVAVLLVVSFSRRNGPIRVPLAVPRTSPVEFADSMGHLYRTANAVEAPLATARAQTLRYLAEDCGLSHTLLRQPPRSIADALSDRIGGDWAALAEHLEAAARPAESAPTGKAALKLVQALERDRQAIAQQLSARRIATSDTVRAKQLEPK
jgi:hypothetical protein